MSTAIFFAARIVLAITLLIAGISKVLHTTGTATMMEDLGVPSRITNLTAATLPFVEILLAVSLCIPQVAGWAELGTFLLILTFTIAVAVVLKRGVTIQCNCFGELSRAVITWRTLLRNIFLLLLALGITLAGGITKRSVDFNALDAYNIFTIITIALAASAWATIRTISSQTRRTSQALDLLKLWNNGSNGDNAQWSWPGVPIGQYSHDFKLFDLNGNQASLSSARKGRSTQLLVFVSPTCGPCRELLPMLASWREEYANHLAITLIGEEDLQEQWREALDELELDILLQRNNEVATAYGSSATPSGLLIDSSGVVASPLLGGAQGISRLVQLTTSGLPGTIAPMNPWPPPWLPHKPEQPDLSNPAGRIPGELGCENGRQWCYREVFKITRIRIEEDCQVTCDINLKSRNCTRCVNKILDDEADMIQMCIDVTKCPPGQWCIDDSCRPTGCGKTCPPCERCNYEAGKCESGCSSGETCCDNQCIDIQTSRSHCGDCGKKCGPDQICTQGVCVTVCANGLVCPRGDGGYFPGGYQCCGPIQGEMPVCFVFPGGDAGCCVPGKGAKIQCDPYTGVPKLCCKDE